MQLKLRYENQGMKILVFKMIYWNHNTLQEVNGKIYTPWSYAAKACEPTTPFDTHLHHKPQNSLQQ